MSVCYEANFGIGFQIECPIDENDKTTYRHTLDGEISDMYDFCRFVAKDSKYILCSVGDWLSSENDIEWFLFMKEPFSYGFDLTKEAEDMEAYCRDMKFKIIGTFGCYGGLEIG